MGRQIRQAAIELAQLALEAQDSVLTAWAAERGLRVWPTDDDLLEMPPPDSGASRSSMSPGPTP